MIDQPVTRIVRRPFGGRRSPLVDGGAPAHARQGSGAPFRAAYAYLPGEQNLLFLQVPEGRVAKNRVHLDLEVDDLDEARGRAEPLGAKVVHEKDEYGVHWFTYQDPEGNEFCMAAH